jgi:hypothetical protein
VNRLHPLEARVEGAAASDRGQGRWVRGCKVHLNTAS